MDEGDEIRTTHPTTSVSFPPIVVAEPSKMTLTGVVVLSGRKTGR